MSQPMLYASVGELLTRYEIDLPNGALIKQETIALPDTVQYVWPHPKKRVLYVVSSNRAPVGGWGLGHHLTAFSVDSGGRLSPLGKAQALPHRPIHLALDNEGRYAFVAYSVPSGITVHPLAEDGSPGEAVPQPEPLELGIYAHQARAMPDNRTVLLVTRGHSVEGDRKVEEPGALKFYSIGEGGVLRNKQSVAPNGGFGFGPRHIDFHPTRPWMYVSLERQNTLQMFEIGADGTVAETARHSINYLENPDQVHHRQMGGTVHVHPNGRFVYGVNRADHTKEVNGEKVLVGGENSIVVFSIDERTGEPRLIQRVDPHTMHVRTFAIDPSGKLLVAAGILPLNVPEGAGVRRVPAALSVFRIGDDGRLTFVRKHDVDAGPKPQWWMGIVDFAN